MTIIPKETNDGSWTCFNEDVGEHYHNISGAASESYNLYIAPLKMAERLAEKPHLVVLDPFLGLGYNTLACLKLFLELQATQFPEARLTLLSIENDPDILAQIPTILDNGDADILKILLTALEHKIYYQTQSDLMADLCRNSDLPPGSVELKTIVGDCRQVIPRLPEAWFDVIFHDAFSPKKQPELWTQTLFEHYRRILYPVNGAVLTYSASAAIRQGMVDAGLYVYQNPFVCHVVKPGTSAFVSENPDATPLAEKDLALMASKSGIPYQDSSALDLSREMIIQKRDQELLQSSLKTSSAVHREFNRSQNS